LDVEWLGLEIHPENPAIGVKLSERFSKANLDNMLSGLNHSGSLYGIKFGALESPRQVKRVPFGINGCLL
jgi:hypothetical protein